MYHFHCLDRRLGNSSYTSDKTTGIIYNINIILIHYINYIDCHALSTFLLISQYSIESIISKCISRNYCDFNMRRRDRCPSHDSICTLMC